MANSDKFIVRSKKVYGENTVVSCHMPVELVKKLDAIGNQTGRTPQILDILKNENVPATFFVKNLSRMLSGRTLTQSKNEILPKL